MRKLYLLRGAPGAGKSTFIERNKLQNYTLSADMFRLLLESPQMNISGEFEINQAYGREDAWAFLYKALAYKMKNGEMIIVDACHSKVLDILKYQSLAKQYRYEIAVIDFTTVPKDIALERNLKRESYKFVPEGIIEKKYVHFKSEKLPKDIKVIPHEMAIDEIYKKAIDLSSYKKIHHIGDIHGSYDALMKFLSKGLNPNELYVFTGDYLDRGIQNVEVMGFLLSIMDEPNVVFIEGNHEFHLWKWVNDEISNSTVFENETKIQLEDAGIDKSKVKRFCLKLKEALHYNFGQKEVVVTHGGLAKMIESISILSAKQLIRGVGTTKAPIDQIFEANHEGSNKYQIHGHRNFDNVSYTPDSHSFNLEGAVEMGGYLRIITLDAQGFNSTQIKNNNYKRDLKVS